MIVQRREFANYLRKNSSVKGDARPARFKVRVLVSWNNAKGHQTPYGEGTAGLPRQPSHR
jgi:hypothetical protein